jgi:hypothetical protein
MDNNDDLTSLFARLDELCRERRVVWSLSCDSDVVVCYMAVTRDSHHGMFDSPLDHDCHAHTIPAVLHALIVAIEKENT